jgi:hypothetical protein
MTWIAAPTRQITGRPTHHYGYVARADADGRPAWPFEPCHVERRGRMYPGEHRTSRAAALCAAREARRRNR